MMDITSDYKSVLFEGCAIEYKDISLCNLGSYVPSRLGMSRTYQVHSKRHKFSKLYKNIDDAVAMFLELKRRDK
mgnify:FL=1|tara:strand:+ start:858 stop:1079 length:222 start_codon:yes stop_codon:yes gene_type:complete